MPASRIDDLNPEQLRAATAGEGPVITIAGAGTGKTKTLAARMAWLVSQGIDPGRIMLLTFTRRASEEMLRRARRALGESGSRTLGTVWGGTFYSVANRLLRTYGEAIGLDSDFTVMDQSDAEDLMHASAPAARCCRRWRRWARRRWVNIASDLPKQPEPALMAYGACKAALLHLTKNLAKEYAPKIRVNAVSPGPVWTRLWTRRGGIVAHYGVDKDAAVKRFLEERYMPLGIGQPEDVAHAVVFLASPLAKFITGANLDVGGTLLRLI